VRGRISRLASTGSASAQFQTGIDRITGAILTVLIYIYGR